ncbi:hypothetical protein BJ742DRAFT_771116 [Cladochytrium replicatum]|nr:hypothetical protein BJ742DRAFT_771116 [Cladochytrium replicatum]
MLLNAYPTPSLPIAIPDKGDYVAAQNLLALADNSISRTPDSSRADSPPLSDPESIPDHALPSPPPPTQAPQVRTRTLPHRVKVKQEMGAYAWRDLSASPEYGRDSATPAYTRRDSSPTQADNMERDADEDPRSYVSSFSHPFMREEHFQQGHFAHLQAALNPDHHAHQHEHMYDPMASNDHQHALSMMALMADDSQSPSPQPAPAYEPVQQKRRHFPKEVVRDLIAWLHEHKACPFPDRKTKLEMIELYNLSETQLENWFVNGRRRYLSKTRTPSGQIVYVVRMPGKKGPKPKHGSATTPATPTPPSSVAPSPCTSFANAVAQMRIRD